MKTIALLSNTPIIDKIFILISNKLMIHLKIYKFVYDVAEEIDLIVVDDTFFDENIIKLRSFCDTLVLLKNDNSKEDGFDFIIEKPFLPSTLSTNLEKILISVDEKINDKKNEIGISTQKVYATDEPTQDEITDDLAKFIDSLVNEVDEENFSSNDLIVKKEQLGHGGVLDKDELSKLYDMINDDKSENYLKNIEKEDDWIELSDIIDKAIDDVLTYQFKDNQPIKLSLNQYSIEELAPLLKKLNQNIIDSLTEGNEITLQLRLENNG
ncbi:MAG: hypothetical protein L0Y61_07105 [Epsilonproteobacteria bacterium]|nr:hypothetical protein [Campylobacterota bacterium]